MGQGQGWVRVRVRVGVRIGLRVKAGVRVGIGWADRRARYAAIERRA